MAPNNVIDSYLPPAGPAFNFFLSKCNFKVGPFLVNNLTAPGVSEL